jgi:hypothetical protein
MPRTKKKYPATERLNLIMSKKVRLRLERLRDQIDADSLAEVIRYSLAVYDFLLSEKKRGGELLVRSSDGKTERPLVLYP